MSVNEGEQKKPSPFASSYKELAHSYVNVAGQYLDDDEYDYIYEMYPGLPASYREGCPTCHGQRSYEWRGATQKCDCRTQLALHKHYLSAGVGHLFQVLTWDDYEGDPEAVTTVLTYLLAHREYVPAGIGLILRGLWGTGKTMLALLAAKELIKLGYSVYCVTFREMLDQFASGWTNSVARNRFDQKMVRSQVLILDDIGKEYQKDVDSASPMARSTFDHLLRQRAMNLRSTILTTNMSVQELEKYGSAVFSLIRERCWDIEVGGSDYREQAKLRTLQEVSSGWARPIV